MIQTKSITLLLFCSLILFLSNCASLSGFKTGRTVEKGHVAFSGTLNVTQTPDLNIQDEEVIPTLYAPILEIGGRFGITNKTDIGVSANSATNVMVDGRYQIVGDKESLFAVSIGAAFGVFGLAASTGVPLLNFQLPLYTSFHPTKKIHIYCSPRFIGQTIPKVSKLTGLFKYSGVNVGILFGEEVQFGLDFGYYNLKARGIPPNNGLDKSLINVGTGLIFKF